MSLAIGIVGLPNVGKSTLFKAVTNKQIDVQNYPFTTIEPNVGVVEVPDERVDRLAELSHSAKKLYATVEFTDIAGLVKGASQGEGLGNKFLANIREVDAIAHVVRAFDDPNVTHVHGALDAALDVGVINAELIIADLDTVVARLEGAKKKQANDKAARAELSMLERFATALQTGTLISSLELATEEWALLRQMNLLTAKPFIFVLNVSEGQLAEGWQPPQDLVDAMGGAQWLMMSNKLELELSELGPEEKNEYIEMFKSGLPGSRTSGTASGGTAKQPEVSLPGLDQLITTAYRTLGLISFLTTGEKETRAWTTKEGSTAPVAARAIHTDFERLFIRAQVIAYEDLVVASSWAKARELGKVRTEGKDYIVQDGDVVEILIGS